MHEDNQEEELGGKDDQVDNAEGANNDDMELESEVRKI